MSLREKLFRPCCWQFSMRSLLLAALLAASVLSIVECWEPWYVNVKYLGNEVGGFALAPDERHIAVAEARGVTIRGLPTLERVRTLPGKFASCAYSPNGKLIAALSMDSATCWNVETGSEVARTELPLSVPQHRNLGFSGNDCVVIEQGESGFHWDLASNQLQPGPNKVPPYGAQVLEFNMEGQMVVPAVIDVPPSSSLWVKGDDAITPGRLPVGAIASKDGNLVVAHTGTMLKVWRPRHAEEPYAIAYRPEAWLALVFGVLLPISVIKDLRRRANRPQLPSSAVVARA